MLDSTIWMLVTIGGPVILAAATAYVLLKQRRLTASERSELREAVDEIYADPEESDGCPIRIDTEKRHRADKPRSRETIGRWAEGRR